MAFLLMASFGISQSGICSFGAEQTTGNAATTLELPANPVHHCTKGKVLTDCTDWSYVYFGSYPQSEVTDTKIISAIDAALTAKGQTKGDIEVNNVRYRKTDSSDANSNKNFGNSTYRYFKWEKIKWRVLSNSGNKLFLMADRALDCHGYNETDVNTTWETCTIRSWLNGYGSTSNGNAIDYSKDNFYQSAFSASEQKAILTTSVANPKNWTFGTAAGKDTTDKIFLLSINEVVNKVSDYGFCTGFGESSGRWIQSTAYAGAMGVNTVNSSHTGGNDNAWWWLRSPGFNQSTASNIYDCGDVEAHGTRVAYQNAGVVPALNLDISSGLWSTTDNGTGGEVTTPETETPKPTPTVKETERPTSTPLVTVEPTPTVKETETPEPTPVETVEPTPTAKTTEKPADIKVKALKIFGISKKIAAGKKIQLSVTVKPANATNQSVTWKSSNTKYATVNAKGMVTMKKAGVGKTVTITAIAKDGSNKKASYKIKIMKHAVKKITIANTGKSVKAGRSLKLKATVITWGKSANKTVKWMSSDTKYATVSKSGKVITKKAGKGKTVIITAMATDGSGRKARVKIKIV